MELETNDLLLLITSGKDIKESDVKRYNALKITELDVLVNSIIDIESNLEKKESNYRKVTLRNCTRCIFWIENADNSYRKILTKKYVYIKKENKNTVNEYDYESYKYEQSAVNMSSVANNVIGNIYAENVVFSASKGHGYAAEQANNLYDNLMGKDAKIIGSDLKKNGADRLVNGVQIQTKYCATGSRCVAECFEGGQLRYINADGTPMKIEVPSDKYEDAVKAMENRIKNGEVPGVSDVSKAREIIKRGKFTYLQAKNVAKFGKIESITYDAINGVKVMGSAFSISAIVTFACAVWNGEDINSAISQSIEAGMKIGGISWVSSIITAQIGRTGIETGLRPFTDYLVKNIDKTVLNNLTNGLRASGTQIYGAAAANHLSKMLRGNIITSSVSTAVLSFVDINRLVKGEISGNQAFKNITTTASGVAGGGMGFFGGAALGASIGSVVPIIGTSIGGTVGGIIGGISGSSIATKATKNGLDNFIEDDAKKMMEILTRQLEIISNDYLLNKNEIKEVIRKLSNKDMSKILRTMYSSSKREKYSYDLIENVAFEVIDHREVIKL